jgi:hypothetical protein
MGADKFPKGLQQICVCDGFQWKMLIADLEKGPKIGQ